MTAVQSGRNRLSWTLALVSVCLVASQTVARGAETADEEFARQPTWTIPAAATVRADVFKWLEARKVEPAERDRIAHDLWPAQPAELSSAELLERVVKTIARVDAPARELVDLCAKPRADLTKKLPALPWLTDAKTPILVRGNLRLWYGRWLVQEGLYDESLAQLTGLQPADVVDPAALLFYQGADQHYLLQKEPTLQTLGKLLEQKKHIPSRYAQMAELMQADIKDLKDGSLDHIGRQMRGVSGDLDHARAGKKVRTKEDRIIAALDKLIQQKEEEQQQAMMMMMKGNGSAKQPSTPMPDSILAKLQAPGTVGKRDTGHGADWGNLNPKDRDEALQAIGEEFPSTSATRSSNTSSRLAADETEEKEP